MSVTVAPKRYDMHNSPPLGIGSGSLQNSYANLTSEKSKHSPRGIEGSHKNLIDFGSSIRSQHKKSPSPVRGREMFN